MRSIGRALLVAAGVVAGLAANGLPHGTEEAAATVVQQDAAHGQELWGRYGCYECHGWVGQGAPLSGPRLVPNLAAFPAFSRQVWEPRDQMPPYSREYVSEADVADLYAYLQALPPSPDADDIPLLNQ